MGSGAGAVDSEAQLARSTCPAGIALDAQDNLFVAYPDRDSVRKLTPDGGNTTVVGQPGVRGIAPGPMPGTLVAPTDVSVDAAGNVIIGSAQTFLKVRFDK